MILVNMEKSTYLFSESWKNILAVLIIVALTFLDKIIPPFGIPIALICIFLLFRIKKLQIKHLGLFKPASWIKTISLGVLIGILLQAFSIFILSPIREWFGIIQETPEAYQTIEGNNSQLIIYLLVSWTTAGFGEELVYRSFFLGQFASVFGNAKYRWTLSLIFSSVLFGLWHFNNGVDAIIGTGITGFILGLVYLKSNRNIWTVYIAHAVANTVGFLIIYSGLYKVLI